MPCLDVAVQAAGINQLQQGAKMRSRKMIPNVLLFPTGAVAALGTGLGLGQVLQLHPVGPAPAGASW